MIFTIALIACNNGEKISEVPKPKYRTVFFGNGILELSSSDPPVPVRVMLDTATMPGFHYLCATDFWRKLPSRYGSIDTSTKIDHIDANDYFRYYTTYRLTVALYRPIPTLLFANCEYQYQPNGYYSALVADLSHQRRITGREIDVVIGTSWARNSFIMPNDDPNKWTWANSIATTESGEKVNLLEYYTDSQMQVPYDWGR